MATQQVVNVGSQPNDATGDLLRDAFTKVNNNFAVFFTGNFPTAQMTIGPPVSGNALTAVGISGSAAIVATAFSVTDISLTATGTASFAGGATFGTPTGGNKGAGSINTTSLFVNNVAVLTGSSGVSSFTSNTGLSTNVAATGAVTVTNTGVLSVTTNTGLSANAAATGAVTITNTGVLSITGTANQIAASSSTGAVTLSFPQNLIIPAPTSGTALTVNGPTSGTSGGIFLTAGLVSSDNTVYVGNAPNSAAFFRILGDGHGFLGAAAGTTGISWTTAGNVSVLSPSSGDALTVTNVAGANAITIAGNSAGTAVLRLNTTATTGANSVTLAITNKPGAAAQTTPAKWLPVNLDGTTYYIPAFS
jgi:trimeric autotransporter adhesin